MRIRVGIPQVNPNEYRESKGCPYGCGGEHFKRHGVKGEEKNVRDLREEVVISYRQECLRCGRTFRVYPQEVSKGTAQTDRVKGISVLLYVLGISYESSRSQDATAAAPRGEWRTAASGDW